HFLFSYLFTFKFRKIPDDQSDSIIASTSLIQLFFYFSHFRMRFMASTQSSCLPKAVSRIYPSPLGPKPTPGVPTTLASYSICSKNRQEPVPSGVFSQM